MIEKLIPEGEIIIFTEGDYEDYNVIGLYQAIRNIPPDVINRYVKPARQFSRYESVEPIYPRQSRSGKELIVKVINPKYKGDDDDMS